MEINTGPQGIADILNERSKIIRKPAPAYPWQDLALRVIQELSIPNFKRSSVFKVCKTKPRLFVETCLNETKELCKSGEQWKYFFKVVEDKKK